MQSPVQIDFLGLSPSPALRQKIERHLADLEQRFGRITSCRIAIRGPSEHHRTGLYEVDVHLMLPNGRGVDINRTPPADERRADLDFAVNDAFKRARRKLQDRVRLMQGKVKTPRRPPTGKVVRLEADFGILEAPDGSEIYFERGSVLNDAFTRLEVGDRVTFAAEPGAQGPRASTVKPQGKHGLRVEPEV